MRVLSRPEIRRQQRVRGLSGLFDPAIERVVLGTLLHGGENSTATGLCIDDFGAEMHRLVWASIKRLAAEVSVGVDAVAHDLIERGELESVGGLAFLVDLHAEGIPGVGLEGFAHTLREKTRLRRATWLTQKLAAHLEVYGLNGAREALSEAAEELLELADGAAGPERGHIRDPSDIPAVGATQEQINYIREELPEGSVVALTGDSESGKSTLATAWARDAALDKRSVFYLDRENPRATVLERMMRLGLPDCPELRWWGNWCVSDAPDPGSALLARWVQSCRRAPLVVVDSLSAFHGEDENDATLMRKFMNGLRRLASLGAGVLMLHHVGKAPGVAYRGSSDFKAAIDQGFVVSNVSSNRLLDRLRLSPFKSRYGLTEDITYLYADGRMQRDERPHVSLRTQAEQLTELLRQHPGIKSGEFEEKAEALRISRGRARAFLQDGVVAGKIELETGRSNAKLHSLKQETSA